MVAVVRAHPTLQPFESSLLIGWNLHRLVVEIVPCLASRGRMVATAAQVTSRGRNGAT